MLRSLLDSVGFSLAPGVSARVPEQSRTPGPRQRSSVFYPVKFSAEYSKVHWHVQCCTPSAGKILVCFFASRQVAQWVNSFCFRPQRHRTLARCIQGELQQLVHDPCTGLSSCNTSQTESRFKAPARQTGARSKTTLAAIAAPPIFTYDSKHKLADCCGEPLVALIYVRVPRRAVA